MTSISGIPWQYDSKSRPPTTASNLYTYAGLKQQQIGELDEHGNVNLTMGSHVFAGKQSTSTLLTGQTAQIGQYVDMHGCFQTDPHMYDIGVS